MRNTPPVGPYSSPKVRLYGDPRWVGVFYERGAPVAWFLETNGTHRRRFLLACRGTSLTRKRTPLEPYRTPMPMVPGKT